MSFDTEIKQFLQTHPFCETTVDGIPTKYLLCGRQDAQYTLVYLVGGTGISAVWFQHILKMEADYRILTMDYPMEITTNEKLAVHILRLVDALQLENPVFIGASLGGFLAQLVGRLAPERVAGICLYSTCSLSETSVADLKKQYGSYGMILKLMKIVPYSWIRRLSIGVSKKQVGVENEQDSDRIYMEDFFTWVYNRYTKEFDVHMTTLLVDIAQLSYMTKEDYARFDDRSLLVLPKKDKAFSEAAQKNLIDSMPRAKIERVNGGHTATLFKVEEYVAATRRFIEDLEETHAG
ncbi:alpha/beta hydrolase [Kineothrix sp. MSJ-39]|uniref:alpha/beta fold hydrolase n=1 Tax=Kineothrix sp. MSJ-39 TaxID=2841533 RepID=UPI001C1108D9|nr:alpha/beta hydrolase [Kineothrix sp. MSJ-39]MBU5430000.1 alpha/beta hydrolase [Kineothrix sp. MSJ-39]